jgi:hypothetical protein
VTQLAEPARDAPPHMIARGDPDPIAHGHGPFSSGNGRRAYHQYIYNQYKY